MIGRIVVFALCAALSCALHLDTTLGRQPSKLDCSRDSDSDLWGVVVDGRDALQGKLAYGEDYLNVLTGLKLLLRMADGESNLLDSLKYQPEKRTWFGNLTQAGTELTLDHFLAVKRIVGQYWRTYPNPVSAEYRDCHDVIDPKTVDLIMDNVNMVMDKNYQPGGVLEYPDHLRTIFATYNSKMRAADEDKKLDAIGWLMQNLAFLHPLLDRNGRSRNLLIQFELRRNNMACGTMMYNNNKDIYFTSPQDYVLKLREGIDVYNQAKQNGFVSNPWVNGQNSDRHNRFFFHKTDSLLDRCWANISKDFGRPL